MKHAPNGLARRGRGARRCFESVFVALLTIVCCANQASNETPDAGQVLRIPVRVEATSGAATFEAEIADTPEARTRGLMFRESLGPSRGMLFLFPSEGPRSFWMKNTLIPLDMIFIRSDRRILGIVENAEPKTTTSRSVPGHSQFVLELNGGTVQRLGIEPGQRVHFVAPIPLK